MNLYFDIFVVAITTYVALLCFKKILKKEGNTLDFCLLAFYALHILPLMYQLNGGIPDTLAHVNVGYAMEDKLTDIIYGIICMGVIILLYILSKRIKASNMGTILSKSHVSSLLRFVMMIFMFAPLIAVFFAPNPSIYGSFSYFYTHNFNDADSTYIYHGAIIGHCMYLSLLGLCYNYYTRTSNKLNILFYLLIIMDTWIDGKRTLLLFMLVGILAVDLIKGNYSNPKLQKHQIVKTIAFVIVIFTYFLFYSEKTGKGTSVEFYYLYSFYFSRMSILKTAIYDQLYTHSILDYPLQTILFNIFIWIPRAIWSGKPVMYCIYFTMYADGASSQLPYNLQVNMWSEFVSNMWFLGPLVGVLFIYWMTKVSIKTKSSFVYLCGTAFCVLYCMYGFEHMISAMFYLWLVLVIYYKYVAKQKKQKILNFKIQ